MFKEGIAKFLKLDQAMERLTAYVETRIEILKYDLREDGSRIASRVSVYLFLLFIGTFFLLFLSTAIAFELTRHVGMFWGFAMVSGVYLAAGIVIYIRREPLMRWIEQEIKTLLKQKKH